MQKIIVLALITSLCISCAGPYRGLTPSLLPFNNSQTSGPLEISYAFEAQKINRNKRYAKKEDKFGMKAIGVRIKNNSNSAVTLTESNLAVYVNNSRAVYIPSDIYASKVKQTEAFYMLHTLWGIGYERTETVSSQGGFITTSTVEERVTINPLIVLGPYNTIRAANANAKHKRILNETSIFNKTMAPGETLFGTILIKSSTYEALEFRYTK